jgi:RNA polymerase sigma factor (sigma-70 family)
MAAAAVGVTELSQIVWRIQASDMQGLEDLHVRFGSVIRHILFRFAGSDWEEYYTEILYTIFTAIQKNGIRNSAALPGIVATIARRTAYNEIRRRQKHESLDGLSKHIAGSELTPALEKKLAANQRNPEQELVSSEEIAWMHWGLKQLPAADQDIMRRFYVDGQSIEHITSELNLTDNQFRLRKCRAKAHLVKIIRKQMSGKKQAKKPDTTEFDGNLLAA